MNPDKLTWYVARSGGIVAWSILALSLIFGLALSGRLIGQRGNAAWTLSVHRFLGGLGVIFTAIHVAAIMLDDFVDFGPLEVAVPWASTWRPGPTAWGIIAMYLMVAIELTSFAMRRMPRPLWSAVHWMSAPLFIMASVHGYQSGADAGRAFTAAISGAILILTILTVARVRATIERTEARVRPRLFVARAGIGRTPTGSRGSIRGPAPELYDEEYEFAADASTCMAAGFSERGPRVHRTPGPARDVWKRPEEHPGDHRQPFSSAEDNA